MMAQITAEYSLRSYEMTDKVSELELPSRSFGESAAL